MKKIHPADIINELVCPQCKSDKLELSTDNEQFRSGRILCSECNSEFKIENGILMFLNNYLKTPAEYLNNKDAKEHSHNIEWKISEKNFWDNKKYTTRDLYKRQSYNRLEPRRKHIVKYLTDNLKGKFVVEFGSGDSSTLFYILNPEKYEYNLISTDISYNALLLAKDIHPESVQIQCDACDPPFRKDSIDIIVNFGTYHHLPDNLAALKQHIAIIKKGGLLALHEPIDRRKPFINKNNKLKKKIYNYEESDHNEFIVENDYIKTLTENGEIIHRHYEYSPLRTLLVLLFIDKMKSKSKLAFKIIELLDQILIRTIGKIFRNLGPNSILLVWKKN